MAQALHAACAVHCLRRDHKDLTQQAEALIRLANDQGFDFWLSMGHSWRGRALAEAGPISEGISQLQQSMATVRNMGWTVGETEDLCALAAMYGKLGKPAAGMPMVDEAMQIAVRTGQRRDEAELCRIKGELFIAS